MLNLTWRLVYMTKLWYSHAHCAGRLCYTSQRGPLAAAYTVYWLFQDLFKIITIIFSVPENLRIPIFTEIKISMFFYFFFYFEVTAAILLPLQIYNHDIWCPRKSLYTNFEIGPILKYLPATPLMTKEGHLLLRKLAETNFGQTDRHRDYQRALITMFFKTIISWVLRVLSINVKCFTYFKCI